MQPHRDLLNYILCVDSFFDLSVFVGKTGLTSLEYLRNISVTTPGSIFHIRSLQEPLASFGYHAACPSFKSVLSLRSLLSVRAVRRLEVEDFGLV